MSKDEEKDNDIEENIIKNSPMSPTSNLNNDILNSSTLSGFLRNSSSDIDRTKSDSINYSDEFSDINPLRDLHTKRKKTFKSSKKKALMESIVNLKIQFILFNIKDFIRKYQIKTNPDINTKSYKFLIFTKNISLITYGIIIFFERPWFCFKSATIPLPSYFQFKSSCDNVAFSGHLFSLIGDYWNDFGLWLFLIRNNLFI